MHLLLVQIVSMATGCIGVYSPLDAPSVYTRLPLLAHVLPGVTTLDGGVEVYWYIHLLHVVQHH